MYLISFNVSRGNVFVMTVAVYHRVLSLNYASSVHNLVTKHGDKQPQSSQTLFVLMYFVATVKPMLLVIACNAVHNFYFYVFVMFELENKTR